MDRVEAVLLQLTERVNQLTEAQTRTETRLDRLTERVDQLAEAQIRTEARLDQLTAAQTRTEKALEQLAIQMNKLIPVVAEMRGDWLEMRYQRRAGAYFGKLLRKVHGYFPDDLADELDTRLSEAAFQEILRTDLFVRGLLRDHPGLPEVWLTVEVSAVVDREDVQRAWRRAKFMREAGYFAVAVVAGDGITESASYIAKEEKVVVLINGRVQWWDEALALSGKTQAGSKPESL